MIQGMRTPNRSKAWGALLAVGLAGLAAYFAIRFELFLTFHTILHHFEEWHLGDILVTVVVVGVTWLAIALGQTLRALRSQRAITRKVLSAHTHAMETARDETALARENAELANDAKSELYQRVIDDVQGSAANVRAKLALVRSQIGNLSVPEAQYLVEEAAHDVDALDTLVSDLQRADVLQRDALVTTWEPVNLVHVLATAVDAIEPLARSRGIKMHFAPGTLARREVKGNSDRLLKALVEVLLNNITRSNQGNRVVVELLGDRLSLIVRIKDEGQHISSKLGKRLFDTLGIDPSAMDPNREGEAINLQAAQWIIERHRGKISFENLPGNGVAFLITLPALQASAAPSEGHQRRASDLSTNGT